nr:expressed protein [Hymenolepis microstoma]
MSAASQCYSKLGRHRDFRIEIPEFNNRESGSKSSYFQYGLYVPSQRKWLEYHRHRSLPPCAHPDFIDIQKESEYITLRKKLHSCGGSTLAGNLPGKIPSVSWNNHKRFPQRPCVFHHFARCYDPRTPYPCSFTEAFQSFRNPICQKIPPNCLVSRSLSCPRDLN